jgi:(E)-4-hydroxy-3-methylbut-2-enyl-diphosphate synthase
METKAAVEQAMRMIDNGCEYVRFTAQGEREARNLGVIREELKDRGYTTPLVADIHFNPRAADTAARNVEKVRINPGNYINGAKRFTTIEYTEEEYKRETDRIRERFTKFLNLCRENNTSIRIGVNHGSLSERILNRYGDTPEGMVESCMEFLRICVDEDFRNVVISIKSSNTVVMVQTVRLLTERMDNENMRFPLHLGVTEAGDGEDGRIKSAVGIGALLSDGIGDTIRVSLSEDPEYELPVAKKLASYITERLNHRMIIAKEFQSLNLINRPLPLPRRETIGIRGTGGGSAPSVIAESDSCGKQKADWFYTKYTNVDGFPVGSNIIIDYDESVFSGNLPENIFPLFTAEGLDKCTEWTGNNKFLYLTYDDVNDRLIRFLSTDRDTILIIESNHVNPVGELRAFIHLLANIGSRLPAVLKLTYDEKEKEDMQIKASADFGAMFIDGLGDGIMLCNKTKNAEIDCDTLVATMFGILQATRVRMTKTEYISCPGCGRTLFDLKKTIADVKKATTAFDGMKIGIMGCIVNGPGEMADADYGYVGAGPRRVNLYKGKTVILKNIPEDEAVTRLLELIEKDK